MPIKYVVHPGEIESKNDGQLHYIGYSDLIRLYRVDPRECVRSPDSELTTARWEECRRGWVEPEGAIHLYPDYHGKYKLPTAKK